LTAICATGSPTIFAWSGGNCAGLATQSCAASDSNKTVNYSVVISNAIGPGTPNPATKSVLWSASLPNKPSGCSISADVNPLPAGGGTVHLTANCTGGDGVDSWTWTGPTSSSTGNTATASITAASSFGVTATNGGGNGTASLTVNVGGGGGGPISCSGYLNTNVITMNWGSWATNLNAPMGPLDVTVVKFTTGSIATTGRLVASDSPNANPSTKHDYVLSATPCDFGDTGTAIKTQLGAGSGAVGFSIGGSRAPTLSTNSTYYINIRNSSALNGGCSGSGSSCDLNPLSMYSP
jgi:hypothetical protein